MAHKNDTAAGELGGSQPAAVSLSEAGRARQVAHFLRSAEFWIVVGIGLVIPALETLASDLGTVLPPALIPALQKWIFAAYAIARAALRITTGMRLFMPNEVGEPIPATVEETRPAAHAIPWTDLREMELLREENEALKRKADAATKQLLTRLAQPETGHWQDAGEITLPDPGRHLGGRNS